jgi:hypothetical protein
MDYWLKKQEVEGGLDIWQKIFGMCSQWPVTSEGIKRIVEEYDRGRVIVEVESEEMKTPFKSKNGRGVKKGGSEHVVGLGLK